jgi:Protein of unknown function (DUF1580)
MQKQSHSASVEDGTLKSVGDCLDVNVEKLMTFRELTKRIPHRRSNRPLALSTIHRWRANGIRGVRLDAIRIGGSWLTSEEAFARFCQRLTTASNPVGQHCIESAAKGPTRAFLDHQMDEALGLKKSSRNAMQKRGGR